MSYQVDPVWEIESGLGEVLTPLSVVLENSVTIIWDKQPGREQIVSLEYQTSPISYM